MVFVLMTTELNSRDHITQPRKLREFHMEDNHTEYYQLSTVLMSARTQRNKVLRQKWITWREKFLVTTITIFNQWWASNCMIQFWQEGCFSRVFNYTYISLLSTEVLENLEVNRILGYFKLSFWSADGLIQGQSFMLLRAGTFANRLVLYENLWWKFNSISIYCDFRLNLNVKTC